MPTKNRKKNRTPANVTQVLSIHYAQSWVLLVYWGVSCWYNIYDSFINNTCKLKLLLKGPECYKDTQMKACNITQPTCSAVANLHAERCACKSLANFLLTEHLSADVIVILIVFWQVLHLIHGRRPHWQCLLKN